MILSNLIHKIPFYKTMLANDVLGKVYFKNHVLDYIIAICLGIIVFIILSLALKGIITLLVKIVNKFSKHSYDTISNYMHDNGRKMLMPFVYLAGVCTAVYNLKLSKTVDFYCDAAVMIIATLLVTRIIISILRYWIIARSSVDKATGKPDGALYLLFPIIKVVIWILAVFFILSNLKYNISTLLAGFGIGGIAIALAAQTFLGDILSFVSIVADKPFEIGDYISFNDIEGFVVKIGLKSVRISSINGEEIIIPNGVITSSKLQNYKRAGRRAIALEIQIPLDVPNEKLEEIPHIFKQIIEEKPEKLEFVRSNLIGFSDFGYVFKTVYLHVIDTEKTYGDSYNEAMDLQQYVNLRLRTEMDKRNLTFAYPTSDVRVFQHKML